MKFTKYLLVLSLISCQDDTHQLRKEGYWVAFPNQKSQPYAQCLLEYVVQEKFDSKKYQLFKFSEDSVVVRIFGKTPTNLKNPQAVETLEFALRLLANDFSKLCFQGRTTVVEFSENFLQKNKYFRAVSNKNAAGWRNYKELLP